MSSFNAKNHLRASAPQKKKTEFRIPPGRKQTTGHTKLTEQIKRFKSLFFASVKNNAPRGGLPIKRLLCVCFFFVLDLLVRIPTESVRVRETKDRLRFAFWSMFTNRPHPSVCTTLCLHHRNGHCLRQVPSFGQPAKQHKNRPLLGRRTSGRRLDKI